ncbi:DNA alkylation repair protein [Nocardia mangyaensis]|uniref:DNA alkylation repair protein n=1 Tax=Nocardia mangyaensis TaxID=2213200 RepID=UPI0026767EE0|nr:DNA alkylation repair protein [Nocardia mangyaensis]MDO3648084.1 DNA alkylation repair protein [Nocardia mangyaensis]
MPLSTAAQVVEALHDAADPAEEAKIRNRVADAEPVIGVRMGTLFSIAKSAVDLPGTELDALFEHQAFETRMTAFCVLDFRARRKLADDERATLAHLYLDRHDAISTWDMVDRAAPRVLGWPILIEAIDGGVLAELASAADPLRRRSAITAPLWFIKQGSSADIEHGLAIASLLDGDEHPRVRSAVEIYRKHALQRLRSQGGVQPGPRLPRPPASARLDGNATTR